MQGNPRGLVVAAVHVHVCRSAGEVVVVTLTEIIPFVRNSHPHNLLLVYLIVNEQCIV